MDALHQSKATVMLRTNAGPDAAADLLDKHVHNINVLAAIPNDTAGVSKVYRPETAKYTAVVNQYALVAKKLHALPATTVLSSPPSNRNIREAVIHGISNSAPDDLLILVAHNIAGELKLPDGTTITTAEIAQISAEHHHAVLIMSCETIDADIQNPAFVTTRPLYFDEIIAAVSSSLTLANRQDRQVTLGEIVRQINQTLTQRTVSTAHKIVAIAVLSSGVLAMLVLSDGVCERDHNGNCKH